MKARLTRWARRLAVVAVVAVIAVAGTAFADGAPKSKIKTSLAVGVIDRIVDGEVLLAMKMTPREAVQMTKMGFRHVPTPAKVSDRTIYKDTAYIVYRVAPNGPALESLQALIGRRVELKLTSQGRSPAFIVEALRK